VSLGLFRFHLDRKGHLAHQTQRHQPLGHDLDRIRPISEQPIRMGGVCDVGPRPSVGRRARERAAHAGRPEVNSRALAQASCVLRFACALPCLLDPCVEAERTSKRASSRKMCVRAPCAHEMHACCVCAWIQGRVVGALPDLRATRRLLRAWPCTQLFFCMCDACLDECACVGWRRSVLACATVLETFVLCFSRVACGMSTVCGHTAPRGAVSSCAPGFKSR